MKRKFLVPEVVQTSNLDCGPASLKCLLEGFGIPVSYGRLREACQTGLDGTSIDVMETVAGQLGLDADQVMLPTDHLVLDESTFPAIVVVTLPTGMTHFVVLWRRHRAFVQLMDPTVGRRWVRAKDFEREIYQHTLPVAAADWRDFAASEEFQRALGERMRLAGIPTAYGEQLRACALAEKSWQLLAALDAAVRLIASRKPKHPERVLADLCQSPAEIPPNFWSVRPANDNADSSEQLRMRGAVLVRVKGKRAPVDPKTLSPELAAAITERPVSAGRELFRLFRRSGAAGSLVLLAALAAAAGGVMVEALLFRGLFDVTTELGLTGQRMGAMAAILLFSLGLLLLELPILSLATRTGRHIENHLRVAFLEKIPKLGDRYFQSRLTSDMAERSHTTHRLRNLPDMVRQLVRTIFELLATGAGIIWLDPSAAPLVFLAIAGALLPPFLSQPALVERDLRVRSHAAGLTRFYLDAMLGLLAIRAHGAERKVRREHEELLGQWAQAALRLQKTVVSLEAFQLTFMFALIATLLLAHSFQGSAAGGVLLLVYWALNLPVLGQEIAALARQYPQYRNLTVRLLEPLGACEEENLSAGSVNPPKAREAAPAIAFENVTVSVSGNTILRGVDLAIEPASHVAIVGSSGAGKSSLVGVLLGWLQPSSGTVLIDGAPLEVESFRRCSAWVDPTVQLWNRSLLANVAYGSSADSAAVAEAIDTALLRNVLEGLPQGMQTRLGESGGLLSGGEGQRVRMGRAILRPGTHIAILDEPFRGLDREKRRELLMRARILWHAATLLCITHDIAETLSFDRVFVIERGSIVEAGKPADLRADPRSRYAELLRLEEEARSGMWSSDLWRRLNLDSGRLIEAHPAKHPNVDRKSEIA